MTHKACSHSPVTQNHLYQATLAYKVHMPQHKTLRKKSGNISSFKTFVDHLHSKMHYCIHTRENSCSLLPSLADVYTRVFMKDIRDCISRKCELPIFHGECAVISLNNSVNSPEDTSDHNCQANLGRSTPTLAVQFIYV